MSLTAKPWDLEGLLFFKKFQQRLQKIWATEIWNWNLNYNQFHNILRLFDVLPNFPFTTSETIRDYYL